MPVNATHRTSARLERGRRRGGDTHIQTKLSRSRVPSGGQARVLCGCGPSALHLRMKFRRVSKFLRYSAFYRTVAVRPSHHHTMALSILARAGCVHARCVHSERSLCAAFGMRAAELVECGMRRLDRQLFGASSVRLNRRVLNAPGQRSLRLDERLFVAQFIAQLNARHQHVCSWMAFAIVTCQSSCSPLERRQIVKYLSASLLDASVSNLTTT